jgi:hypothetical protein
MAKSMKMKKSAAKRRSKGSKGSKRTMKRQRRIRGQKGGLAPLLNNAVEEYPVDMDPQSIRELFEDIKRMKKVEVTSEQVQLITALLKDFDVVLDELTGAIVAEEKLINIYNNATSEVAGQQGGADPSSTAVTTVQRDYRSLAVLSFMALFSLAIAIYAIAIISSYITTENDTLYASVVDKMFGILALPFGLDSEKFILKILSNLTVNLTADATAAANRVCTLGDGNPIFSFYQYISFSSTGNCFSTVFNARIQTLFWVPLAMLKSGVYTFVYSTVRMGMLMRGQGEGLESKILRLMTGQDTQPIALTEPQVEQLAEQIHDRYQRIQN